MIARQALLVFVATVFPSILGPSFVAATSVPSSHDTVIGSAASLHPYKRDGDKGYTDPVAGGGYMLTIVNGTYPAGLGEPLNVILSTKSDKEVIVKGLDNGGFLNYMLSAGLGEECLGQHLGSLQEANLGDGQGNVTEVEELRWNYGDPYLGTCKETFDGGLHLRYWIQNNTGAYFMAVSEEMDLSSGHDIVPNGYNHGRDHLVGNLTKTPIETKNLTNTSTFSGQTSWNNYTYQTDVHYVSGLLKNSSDGINHYITVSTDGRPAIDGLVAVLTVKIVERPKSGAILSVHASLFAIVPSLLLAAMIALA